MITIAKDGLPKSLSRSKTKIEIINSKNQSHSLLISDVELVELYKEIGKYISQQQLSDIKTSDEQRTL